MVHFLLGLPTALAGDVVSNWLDVKETVRLDTAFCETATRPKFAYILSNCKLRFPPYRYDQNHYDHFVAWSLKRYVCVEILRIGKESDLNVYINFLLQRGATVTKVYYQSRSFGDAGKYLISIVATHCPHLESLDLDGHDVSDHGLGLALRAVLMNCTKLQELFISTGSHIELDYQSLQNICCPSLHSIFFDFLHSAEVLAEFFKMTPKLRKLVLRACNFELRNGESALQYVSPTVDCVDVADLTDNDLIRIVDSCPHVTKIRLSDPQYNSEELTVRSIEYMTRRLKLAELDINYGSFSGECLQAVAKNCSTTLTSLEMMDFPATTAMINAVLQSCTKLTRFRCSTNDLDYSFLSKIKELNLTVYRHQAFLADIAQHCRELVHLVLYYVPVLETPEDLDNIVINCPHLCTLTLTPAVESPQRKYLSDEKIAQWKLVRPKLVVTQCEYSFYP